METAGMTCAESWLGTIDGWRYRAEGNASFVIFNPKTKTVLKLRKSGCSSQQSSKQGNDEDMRLYLDYIQTVIEPLLGSEYVTCHRMVPVTKDFLESAATCFGPQRPRKCLHKHVDISKSSALCLPDVCFLQYQGKVFADSPTFGVEIKPKRGFLPTLCYIPDDLTIKRSVCRFCLHQPFKVQHGVWEKRSHFCPLDLFSCDPSRMKYSLNMMLENPQNNFRIFKDGVLIYQAEEKSTPSLAKQRQLAEHLRGYFGESCTQEEINEYPLKSSCIQSFLDVTIQALLSSNVRNEKFPKSMKVKSSDNCILRRLVAAQLLTFMEIDAIFPLYQKVLQYLEDHPQDSEKYRLDFPYSGNFSLDDETSPSLSALDDDRSCKEVDVSGVSIPDAVQVIRKYLITRTLKDCSVMLAVQPIPQNESSPPMCSLPCLQTCEGRSYMYSATVIDLDPKPSTRIPSYESVDRKIAREYVTHYQNDACTPHE